MKKQFDMIVPMKMEDLQVFRLNVEFMKKNLSGRRIVVIGAEELRKPCRELDVEYQNEDELFEGMTLKKVQDCIEKRLGHKKRAGWYFQQFLKLGYAYVCADDYYIVWDADTIPLQEISHMENGSPIFTKKDEMQPAYFETLDRLFNGAVKRQVDFSFICENMIMNTAIVKEMLDAVMIQPQLKGASFWERILSAVSDEALPASGFSEFETYGNYVMTYYPDLYHLRTLNGLRKGAEFFGMNPSVEELRWAARDYVTIAFESWSYHNKIVGICCACPLVRALVPFRVVTGVKMKIARMRSGD